MNRSDLDALDHEIIRLLSVDGRMAIGEIAKTVRVSTPTVRKRIKALEEKGMLAVSGRIDPDQFPEMLTALVGMNIRSEGKLDQVLERIASLPNVAWAGVVTGRYDIMAEVLCVGGKDELYRFTTETILKMANVLRSETFIIMRSKGNWLQLPNRMQQE